MYLMISCTWCSNYLVRNALPSLLPFVAQARGFTTAQLAMLLAAFFPGYLCTQVPAGILSARLGPKILLTGNMVATSVLTLAMPLVSRSGAMPMAALLTTMGLCQGSLVPCASQMERNWLPTGPERPIVERIMQVFGLIGGEVIAHALTPRIASNHGWHRVCMLYGSLVGSFSVVWALFAANKPESTLVASTPSLGKAGEVVEAMMAKPPQQKVGTGGGGVDWRIFATPPVLAVCFAQVATNNSGNTIQQWGPQYFTSVLGTTPSAAGRYMAMAGVVNFTSGFVVAAIESAMVKMQLADLVIRKVMVFVYALGNSASLLWFGLAATPTAGAMAYISAELFSTFQGSGYGPNYREVGGEDTAGACDTPITYLHY